MKIAIFDIDDTITYESDFLRKYAPGFLERENLKSVIVNNDSYCLDEIYDLKSQFMERGCSAEEAKTKAESLANKFWNLHFLRYNLCRVRPGVRNLINELKKNGYQIHFLSLRGKETKENASGMSARIRCSAILLLTKLMLKINRIYYDRLKLVRNSKEKCDYIKFYNPEIVFEDQISIINNIDRKIIRVCVSNIHNLNKNLPDGVFRLDNYADWSLIEKNITTAINDKLRKNFKNTVIDFSQYIMKNIGRLFFYIKYRPIICGAENIPLKGSVIFVGNHRHKIDPVFISITSPKSIHWAALLRMFQGKEDLFSTKSGMIRRTISAKFIKAMGALPIARPTDNDYQIVNATTISQITFLLRMNVSVGFFPEGTINREPLKTDVLPLKSNRVFRIAVETDSFVQPFSIVWIPKELGIRNRLIIVYSTPINAHKRTKKEVRDLWQEIEICNIGRANELIEVLKIKQSKDRKQLINDFRK